MSAAAQAPIKLAQQGADSLAAALKIISDLTAQQVALVVGMVRERVSFKAIAPIAETASGVVGGFTDAGKILLDLAAGENELLVNSLKEAIRMRASFGALVDLVPLGLTAMFEMNKSVLDTIAKQSREAAESLTEGNPLAAYPKMAKTAREGIESFIETQKTFLDQVAEQVSIATSGGASKASHRDRSKILIELAREGVDKFVEAQKQVTGVMIDQMEAVAHGPHTKAVPQRSLSELTRKSVQNFTTAQKSLLDLALKPMPAAPKAEKSRAPRAARPQAKRRKKPAAAEAATA